jgi:hypothetical protein
MNTKGRTNMNQNSNTPTTLIQSAFALITGWETRWVARTKWHQADALMMQAALIAPESTMDAWEQLSSEYEIYLQFHATHRRAA